MSLPVWARLHLVGWLLVGLAVVAGILRMGTVGAAAGTFGFLAVVLSSTVVRAIEMDQAIDPRVGPTVETEAEVVDVEPVERDRGRLPKQEGPE